MYKRQGIHSTPSHTMRYTVSSLFHIVYSCVQILFQFLLYIPCNTCITCWYNIFFFSSLYGSSTFININHLFINVRLFFICIIVWGNVPRYWNAVKFHIRRFQYQRSLQSSRFSWCRVTESMENNKLTRWRQQQVTWSVKCDRHSRHLTGSAIPCLLYTSRCV